MAMARVKQTIQSISFKKFFSRFHRHDDASASNMLAVFESDFSHLLNVQRSVCTSFQFADAEIVCIYAYFLIIKNNVNKLPRNECHYIKNIPLFSFVVAGRTAIGIVLRKDFASTKILVSG